MRPNRSKMIVAKTTSLCLCLTILLCLWAAPAVFAADNERPQHPKPPLREASTYRVFTWGNDVTVATGPVEGGISLASDTSGNLYAVRCTTGGVFPIYKSTNAGESWSFLVSEYSHPGSSHPVVLTGSNGNKLYLFCLSSNRYGDVRLQRFTETGVWDGEYGVAAEMDTITYFSACTDLGKGDHLMVVYQKEEMGDNTPDLYSIVSTDQGETWGTEVKITEDGSHPDIAYGNDGYVYCVHEKTGGVDKEIAFIRSSDYGASWELGTGEYLTGDSYDQTYPKVAALHHALPDDAHVWVAYNHDWGDGNIDLYYAYSTNAGVDWSKDHPLANSADYDEMACDLSAKPDETYNWMSAFYLRHKIVIFPNFEEWSEVHRAYTSRSFPSIWYAGGQVSDSTAAFSADGIEVCQGAYTRNQVCAIHAGKPSSGNFENLYFDNGAWTAVEDEEAGEEVMPGFSLSANYPNPFNPETRISYFIPKASRVLLEIFNTLGQKIRILVDEEQGVGNRSVTWDGKDTSGKQVASGVYLYRLQADNSVQAKKMVVIR